MPGAEGALNITSPEHQDSDIRLCLDFAWCGKPCAGGRMKEDLAGFVLKGEHKSWVIHNENLIAEFGR